MPLRVWALALIASCGLAVAAPPDPATAGQWAGPYSWPLVAVHATLMPNGKVLLWDDHTDDSGVLVWDPVTETMSTPPYVNRSLFCSGHTILPDGRVLAIGGQLSSNVGVPESNLFTPATQSWTIGADMEHGRYYPTATSLPNGRVLALGGAEYCLTCGDAGGSHEGLALIPEIYDPVDNSWSALGSASLSLPMYTHMFVIPDGRVVATSSAEDPVMLRALDLATQTWTVLDPAVHDGGSSVMYRPGKILKTGSARNPNYPTAAAATTAWVVDTNESEPAWRAVAPMFVGRTQHNLTVLPTGDVLATGGGPTSDVYATSLAAKPAELWSPATEQWTGMAPMSEPRLYHATALLLPDGRVLVAGGGRLGPDYPSGELYSPPYLFRGPRPVIASAPAALAYTGHATIGTPDAARIAKVTLVGLGSVTHAFNQNQRYVELAFTPVAGGLDVLSPASANVAPPGYYMLFLVDNAGVPSRGAIVRFPPPWEDTIPPSAPANLGAVASPGRVDLSWGAASDNVTVTRYNVHRNASPGVTPSPANRIGTSTTTTFTDTGFVAGAYSYVVTAQDAAGNVGLTSNEVTKPAAADTSPPLVAMTSPASGAVLSGVVTLSASAGDDVGILGIQFVMDGAPLGVEDLAAPYTAPWNTHQTANGVHLVGARARDARGNTIISPHVTVTVSNGSIQGLVAAYGFDEGAGSAVKDASGNANRGTVTGAAWTTSGHAGGALSYDGVEDFVTVPNSASLNVAGKGLTIELWANITGSSSIDYALLSKAWNDGSTASPSYQFAIEYDANGGHTLDFYLSDTTSSRRGPFKMSPSTGTWTHIAYTFDGSWVSGYLDGVLKLHAPLDADIEPRPSSLRIGADGGGDQGFRGRIDDLRLYDRALTAAEIQTDRLRPVPPPVPPVPEGAPGTPLRAARANPGGTSINMTWDVSVCVAPAYHAVYGSLATLPAYQIAGGICGLGASGAFSWSSVPAGNLWFVVVADDGHGTEGTWGSRSPGGAMNGMTPSGVCGTTGRVNVAECP